MMQDDEMTIPLRRARSSRIGALLLLVMACQALSFLIFGRLSIPQSEPAVLRRFDAFLAGASLALPPHARILAAGASPGWVFYRATYDLYPRRVFTAFPIDAAHAGAAPPTSNAALERQAARLGATYILYWGIHTRGHVIVRSRDGEGALVELKP